jgi:hypothetical protein
MSLAKGSLSAFPGARRYVDHVTRWWEGRGDSGAQDEPVACGAGRRA